MKKVFLYGIAAILFAVYSYPLYGVDLVKNGKAAGNIVISADAAPPVKYAAQELSAYLYKITGAKLAVSSKLSPTLNNIHIGTLADKDLVKKAGLANTKIKEDGFAVVANGKNLCIVGSNPRGALYGSYHILKKYGGIRFLVPGEEGEYYTKKKNISVPDQKKIEEPFLKVRKTVANEITAFKWLARNNMLAQTSINKFINTKTNKRYDIAKLHMSSKLFSPLRCDTHPRSTPDGKKVIVDSNHSGKRQIYIFDVSFL